MGTFDIRDKFYLNGKPFRIISGSIHYFRVVPKYWEHRLIKLKEMGCNTVETYIPWNFHEPEKGKFDFTGMRDVEAFVHLAQKVGLYVILRPSPYICAEWEFGGLPAWLLKDGEIKLRCTDGPYLTHALEYYDELIPRLAPLQITKGGPVIMMQVENEYGSYGNDTEYLAALRDAMISRGIDVPLVTSDGPTDDMLACGHVDGVFQTGNFGSHAKEQFQILTDHGIQPLMCMEFWVGWFDHWGNGGHKTTPAEGCAKDFRYMLENGNVNIYMFHGGTSFGLMNGSNYYDELTPDVTSYDYDALLTEDGRETEKYRLFKKAIEDITGEKSACHADDIPRAAYGRAQHDAASPLIPMTKGLPVHASKVTRSMEKLGQDYGYTLYRTVLVHEPSIWSIRLCGANDRAIILLNGKPILTMYDHDLENAHTFETPIPVEKGAALEILVENMGRVNYGWKLEHQLKGIDGGVVINNHHHFNWEMVCIDEKAMRAMTPTGNDNIGSVPGVHAYSFNVSEAHDTYLALPGWGKGTVLLNGFTLGRFWEIGPQKTLYIPAPLLKEGKNDILIIETEGKTGEVILTDTPDLG